MKKTISILLVLVLVLSLVITVYASTGHGRDRNKNGSDQKVVVSDTTAPSPTPSPAVTSAKTLEELLAQLKNMQMNNDLRKKLLKLIIDFRKKKGDNTMPVFLNGSLVKLDSPAIIKGNTVYLPAKTILAAIGTGVVEGDSQMIVVFTTPAPNPSTAYIVLDKKNGKIYKNGNEIKAGSSTTRINGKFYLSADLFSRAFDMKVEYDRVSGALLIYSKDFIPATKVVLTATPTPTPAATPTPTPAATPTPTPAT